MPLPSLTECINFNAVRTDSGALASASVESPARRQKLFPDQPLETCPIVMESMNEDEAMNLLNLFRQTGYTRPFAWQPPGATSPAAYRFEIFRITRLTGNTYRAEATTVLQRSVTTT